MHSCASHPLASRRRRFLSLAYELLVWLALVLVGGFIFVGITHDGTSPLMRHLLQAWIVGLSTVYFVWFWTHGGQTVPMKAWRLRLQAASGGPVSLAQACKRFVLATCLFGIGWLWCFVDPDRQFLHDRLAGTCIIDVNAVARAPA